MMNERYVMVTTAHRGVFAGVLKSYTEPTKKKPATATLKDARLAVRWSSEMRGFLGLASIGPDADCRISPSAPEIMLTDVTSITDVTRDARERWEAAPWG